MQQKDMQRFIIVLFLFLLPFKVYASDYDAFILNFLRVNPSYNEILVEMVLNVPVENNVENDLKNGKILKFSINITISQERSILPSKRICTHLTEYYLSYEPLTRQFMVLDDTKAFIKNADARYLLQTLINSLKLKIPATLEENKHYYMEINVSLTQSTNQDWVQKNIFFLSGDIIQPATFEYEFDY